MRVGLLVMVISALSSACGADNANSLVDRIGEGASRLRAPETGSSLTVSFGTHRFVHFQLSGATVSFHDCDACSGLARLSGWRQMPTCWALGHLAQPRYRGNVIRR